MTDSQTIAADKVVTIHYKLTLDGGQVVDSSEGREPLAYLHGRRNIVAGLEQALDGKCVGDDLAVTVAPGEGYGERQPDAVHSVERKAFPPDADLQEGLTFQARDEQGRPLMGSIKKIEGEAVLVDFNHPLAGENLHFAVSVVAVRDATADEKSHGHVH